MEAATPLRQPHVRVVGDRLVVDGLVVADECAVRLVRDREELGGDTVKLVSDAVEIGARVLDREQTGANAEFVRTEFERSAREVELAFSEKARTVAEFFGMKVDEVFGPESGHLSKALEKHFSDESSAAVQHRVRAVVDDVMVKQRADMQKLFSSDDAQNPLAAFQRASLALIKQASDQQDTHLRGLLEKLAALELEIQKLHGEREKQLALDVERERGTAKGRTFEEGVHEAIDAIASAQNDDCDAVGDVGGGTGRKGDVVVSIDACSGPARGRIVFEAKTSRLSKPKTLEELDGAMRERNADYAVLVVPDEERVPAKMASLREYNGDKMIVSYDPEEGSSLGLELAYKLARARVLMARGGEDGLDASALRDVAQRALDAMDDVRRIKQQLAGATTSIEKAREILEVMAERVRAHLGEIETLLAAAPDDEPA